MPKHVDAAERRAALSDAVLAVLERDGIGAVTIRSVAARLGTSTSGVTHYVATREELLDLALGREVERWCTRLAAAIDGTTGIDRVRQLLTAAVLDSAEAEQRVWVAISAAAVHDAAVASALAPFTDWWDATLEMVVAGCGLRGARRTDAVNALDVIATGLVLSRSTSVQEWPRARAEREIDRLTRLVLAD